MIIGYVGTPGSGKTYEAVKTIIANLKRGRRVYTNIDGLDDQKNRRFIQDSLNVDDYEFNKLLVFLQKDEVNRFWEIAKDGSMIVLDEVHKNFSNRDWSSDKNKIFAEWASTHRHHGFDVVLITQDIEKVDKHVRSLLEWCYFFRKVNFFGSAVSQKYICYSYAGDDHNGKPLAKNVRTYNSFIFRCYKSYAHDDAKEVGFMTHVNILKHPVFFLLPVVLGFALYSFSKSSFASGDLFGAKAHMNATAPKANKTPRPSSVPVEVYPPVIPSAPMPLPAPIQPGTPATLSAVRPVFPVMHRYSSPAAPSGSLNKDTFDGHPVADRPAPKRVTGYYWEDKDGIMHITDDPSTVPRHVKVKTKSV